MEYLTLLEKISDPVLTGVLNTLPSLAPADKKEVMLGMLDLLKEAYGTIERLQFTRRTTSKRKGKDRDRDKEKRKSAPSPVSRNEQSEVVQRTIRIDRDRPRSLNFEKIRPFRVKADDYVGAPYEPPLVGPL